MLAARPEAIVWDSTDAGELADSLREWMPVWGAGRVQDLLEIDRAYGIEVMTRTGIRIPTTVSFDPKRGREDWRSVDRDASEFFLVKGHLAEARAFVEEVGGRWVIKPSGSDVGTALTYVATSAQDMLNWIDEAIARGDIKGDEPFILQRYVPGVEISTEIWVPNGELLPPPNSTLETKKFLANDWGPNTGCMTSVVWVYGQAIPRILAETIGRDEFRKYLRDPIGPEGESYPPYHGPLDLNCIVSEDTHEAFGLEWTPRAGWNATYCLLELMEDDPYDVLLAVAKGETPQIRYANGVSYGMRVSIPPHPAEDAIDATKFKAALNAHMTDATDEARSEAAYAMMDVVMEQATDLDVGGPLDSRHVWLLDVKLDEGAIRTAGVDGVVAEITARGERIEQARETVHAIFDDLELANKQARPDGAASAIRRLAMLHAWDYETPDA